MRFELRGRHVDLSPDLRRFVESKLSKLERLLKDRAVSAHASLTMEKHRHRADITLHARGEKFLHGVGDSDNWEAALAEAIAKISHQARKLKTQLTDGRRRLKAPAPAAKVAGAGKPRAAVVVEPASRSRARMPRIVRMSRDAVKPMPVEAAARELDAGGDAVVVFRDVESRAIRVLYRRRNGELMLVETEA